METVTIALGNRQMNTVAKLVMIVASAVAIYLFSMFAFGTNASAATVAKPATCDAAISEVNKSLVLVAKRRIQVRSAKKGGAKKVKRAKRNLKKAQTRAAAARASIKSLCLGSNGVSAQDSKCMLSIDTLAKAIDLKFTRSLRYKSVKVKGKSKKAKKLAAKRKRAMRTQLKRLDNEIKSLTQSFQKTCGDKGSNGNNGNGGGGGDAGGSDTTPPGAVIVSGPEGPTNDPTPTVDITTPENGGHIECRIDGGDWFTVTSPWTLPALSDGVHTITCRYVDAAGNAGEQTTITITVDTTAPGAPTISGPSGPTSDTTPGFNLGGAGEGEHYECRIDGGEWVETGALFVTSELSEGVHTITCRIVDAAGNVGAETSVTVTIDTSAPGSVTISGPAGPTNDTTPTLELTSNESGGHFECRIDGGDWQTVPASWTLPQLSEGTHTITCRYVDGAGNAGPESSITVVIDTTAPGPVTVDGPDGSTNDTTPSFVVSGGGDDVAGYECKVDGGEWVAVEALFTAGPLGEGDHTVVCRAVDAAGNAGPGTTTSVTIDTTAPTAPTVSGPNGLTNDSTPSYAISGGGSDVAGYQCKVDSGAFASVTSPYTTSTLADGAHTIVCRAVDEAGNAGATSSVNVTVDTVAPGAVSINGPTGTITDSTPTYTLSGAAAGDSYQCKVNGGSFANVTSPYTTPALGEGANSVSCRVVDAAGNAGTASSVSVNVDSIGPAITIADGAPRWDGTHAFTLGSSETGTTFKCKIDGGSYATVGANWVSSALSTGSHSVTCYGTDAAGNSGATVTKSFGVFKDPYTVSKNGGFQWGLGCTLSNFLNSLLGCPDNGLTITIPANPNGLTGNYVADLSGAIDNLTAGLSLGSKYTMYIVVDGVAVASDSKTVGFDILGLCGADLAAAKTNLTLSAGSPHTVQLTLKTSALISVFPSVRSSSLSVSIHH